MPSKGVQFYSWIAVDGYRVIYTVPGDGNSRTHDRLHAWSSDEMEVEKHNMGLFEKTGRFQWVVQDGSGNQVATQWNEINPLTGNLGDGTMQTLPQMESIQTDHAIITYGFYDAGNGEVGLPSKDQCWVTVTPNWSSWLGGIAPDGSSQASKPFTTLVLPSSHDVGMNTMQNCNVILQSPGTNKALPKMLGAFGGVGSALLTAIGPVVGLVGPNIVTSLAITQKDPLSKILAIGARYFEFRPAHISNLLEGSELLEKLYFQHLLIPGMAYDEFLANIVAFLTENPTEIVVVQLRWDGVHDSCARPDDNELRTYLDNALGASNGSLEAGNLGDMNSSTIEQLRSAKKRLIMLQNVAQNSSYGDENSTLHPDPIVSTFENVASKQEGSDIAVFQCQATATNLVDVVIYSATFANTSTSPLLCTKPICDQKTLPWLLNDLPGNMSPTKLMVIMNDFFDGATADVAVQVSKRLLDR